MGRHSLMCFMHILCLFSWTQEWKWINKRNKIFSFPLVVNDGWKAFFATLLTSNGSGLLSKKIYSEFSFRVCTMTAIRCSQVLTSSLTQPLLLLPYDVQIRDTSPTVPSRSRTLHTIIIVVILHLLLPPFSPHFSPCLDIFWISSTWKREKNQFRVVFFSFSIYSFHYPLYALMKERMKWKNTEPKRIKEKNKTTNERRWTKRPKWV